MGAPSADRREVEEEVKGREGNWEGKKTRKRKSHASYMLC